MAKASNAAKADKHSPKESRAQGLGWGARRKSQGGHFKKSHKIKSSAGNDEAFNIINKIGVGKKSKNGCLPRMLMMLLPFMFVGAYVFLSL